MKGVEVAVLKRLACRVRRVLERSPQKSPRELSAALQQPLRAEARPALTSWLICATLCRAASSEMASPKQQPPIRVTWLTLTCHLRGELPGVASVHLGFSSFRGGSWRNHMTCIGLRVIVQGAERSEGPPKGNASEGGGHGFWRPWQDFRTIQLLVRPVAPHLLGHLGG